MIFKKKRLVFRLIKSPLFLVISTFTFGNFGFSVTQYKNHRIGYTTDVEVLTPSLNIPVRELRTRVRIPPRKIKIRTKRSKKDERVDPVKISLPRNEDELWKLSKKISRYGKSSRLFNFFTKILRDTGPSDKNAIGYSLERKALKLIDLKTLSEHLSRPHIDVQVATDYLRNRRGLRRSFIGQISRFMTEQRRNRLLTAVRQRKFLALERDLLPPFASRMVRKFIIYRGPNCFHSALAFHSKSLTNSPRVNVKEEKGYHRAMINYDELWRAINSHFYEIDPERTKLEYGDMLVFFSVPPGSGKRVSFRWIRHTATYLFGPYTFSKGSKSPSTPYTVKTFHEEWKTWKRPRPRRART